MNDTRPPAAPRLFDALDSPPPDRILSLMALAREDTRPGKLDLSVGVYRDASGRTPILRSVREAERRLYATEATKSYVGPGGDPAFTAAIARLVFGEPTAPRLRGVQTPGGGGALRILAGLVARARPRATVWLPEPTWVNHESILCDAGLQLRHYPYFDAATGDVAFDAMMAALGTAAPGDAVLLHGCCHNPSGADLSAAQWQALADAIQHRGLVPFVDFAYQGFGEGLVEDAQGVRLLAARLPELALAYSCSKNFGIYRERAGCAFLIAESATRVEAALGQLTVCARIAYSMPPDHGASIVRLILADPDLAREWRGELESMRATVVALRARLADELRLRTDSDHYEFLRRHRGMFSLIGASAGQAERLRREHGIYIVADGRINIAGLRADQVGAFVSALLATRD